MVDHVKKIEDVPFSSTLLKHTEDGHNKFYEILIYQIFGTAKYRVVGRWGKIKDFKNNKPKIQIKGTDLNWGQAVIIEKTLAKEKEKKGYVLYSSGIHSIVAPKESITTNWYDDYIEEREV